MITTMFSRRLNIFLAHFGVNTVVMNNEIYNLAHMLDESSHTSYYDVYMQEHPEDKLQKLIDSLVGEFAEALKKDHIDLKDCLKDG